MPHAPEAMSADRHALVLGAGAVGLSSAYFLRRAGWEVTLVDRGEPGHGCTWGTAGLLCPAHSQPLPGPGVLGKALRWMLRGDSPFHIRFRLDPSLPGWLVGFARACTRARSRSGFRAIAALSTLSLRMFEEVLERGDADFFFERRGGYWAFVTEAGAARARLEAADLRQNGFPVDFLGGDAAREREPALSTRVRAVVFLPGDAHGSSLGFAESLAATLRRQGVRVQTGVRAVGLLSEGRRILGAVVETADGAREERFADETVVALGSFSPGLARTAGVRLPIQPAKGYSVSRAGALRGDARARGIRPDAQRAALPRGARGRPGRTRGAGPARGRGRVVGSSTAHPEQRSARRAAPAATRAADRRRPRDARLHPVARNRPAHPATRDRRTAERGPRAVRAVGGRPRPRRHRPNGIRRGRTNAVAAP